jgi:hypothetical protein
MTLVGYKQAHDINEALKRHRVRYLFIGKLAAILLGFQDTTGDADLFIDSEPTKRGALLAAVRELGFVLTEKQAVDINRGVDIILITNGPFELDLVFAPRGLTDFASSWERHVEVEGFPVCHPDELIAIKVAMNRRKDIKSLPRQRAFLDAWKKRGLQAR